MRSRTSPVFDRSKASPSVDRSRTSPAFEKSRISPSTEKSGTSPSVERSRTMSEQSSSPGTRASPVEVLIFKSLVFLFLLLDLYNLFLLNSHCVFTYQFIGVFCDCLNINCSWIVMNGHLQNIHFFCVNSNSKMATSTGQSCWWCSEIVHQLKGQEQCQNSLVHLVLQHHQYWSLSLWSIYIYWLGVFIFFYSIFFFTSTQNKFWNEKVTS